MVTPLSRFLRPASPFPRAVRAGGDVIPPAPGVYVDAEIVVEVEVAGATVSIDGSAFVAAPASREIEAGQGTQHQIVVRAPGRREHRRSLEAGPGGTTRVHVTAADLPTETAGGGAGTSAQTSIRVVLSAADADATVTLDGRRIAPGSVVTTPGQHALVVSASGRKTRSQTITVPAGTSLLVNVPALAKDRTLLYVGVGAAVVVAVGAAVLLTRPKAPAGLPAPSGAPMSYEARANPCRRRRRARR